MRPSSGKWSPAPTRPPQGVRVPVRRRPRAGGRGAPSGRVADRSTAGPAPPTRGAGSRVRRGDSAGRGRGGQMPRDPRRGHHRAPHQRPYPRSRGPPGRTRGEQVGIVPIGEALRLAQDAELDLVEVAPTARPPVCKLMDYGKFKYESAQKAREARRNQSHRHQGDAAPAQDRPARLRDQEGPRRALPQGRAQGQDHHHVPRPRAVAPGAGLPAAAAAGRGRRELGFVESTPKQDGRNMVMVIAPAPEAAKTPAPGTPRPRRPPSRQLNAAPTGAQSPGLAGSTGRPTALAADGAATSTTPRAARRRTRSRTVTCRRTRPTRAPPKRVKVTGTGKLVRAAHEQPAQVRAQVQPQAPARGHRRVSPRRTPSG